MSRNDEFLELQSSLDDTPLRLDFTLERAQARRSSRQRTKRFVFIPLGSLASAFAVFVLLVNVSPAFAAACNSVPFFGKLAQAVSFSPSLSAAVDRGYVQELNLEQTKDGVTVLVEYAIVDSKQIHIFYSFRSDRYFELSASPEVTRFGRGFAATADISGDSNESLRQISIDCTADTPENLTITFDVYNGQSPDRESAPLCSFDFLVELDLESVSPGEAIELNKVFYLDGQKLTLTTVEIFPTHMRVKFQEDTKNTLMLKDINLYAEDGNGTRYTAGASGALAANGSYILESPYYSYSKELTLCILSSSWLDKGIDFLHINLAENSAEILPDGVLLVSCEKVGDDWEVTFSGKSFDWKGAYAIWDMRYRNNTDGKIFELEGYSTLAPDPITVEEDTRFTSIYKFENYPYDEVWMSPYFTDIFTPVSPIEIKIK